MMGYVVMVDFKLKPGDMTAFRKLIDSNARDSCKLEPGCRRFDVLLPRESNDRIVLYEIYDDRAAFDRHLKMEHFQQFDRASAPFVREKSVTALTLACEGSAPLE